MKMHFLFSLIDDKQSVIEFSKIFYLLINYFKKFYMKKLKLIVLLILSIAFGFIDCAYYKINIERNKLISSGDSSSLLNIFAIQEDNLFHTFNEKGDHLKLSILVENKEEETAVIVINNFNLQYFPIYCPLSLEIIIL